MDFAQQFQRHLARTELGLDRYLPAAATVPSRLHSAMRYSIEAGGKRLRPVLALAAAEQLGDAHDALPAAIALECVHTYSLVHDDLPCMDNDDLRRGRPTAHRAFDEPTALLAGDALLTHAFTLLATAYATEPILATALVRTLGDAAGSQHLIGGQMQDLLSEKKADATQAELEYIHLNKTAAMIEASLVMGGLCGGATPTQAETLRTAGRHLGLAFQIVDDVLDATSDTATLGKTAGKDARADKTTYVKLHGLEKARSLAHEQTAAAVAALRSLPGDHAFLTALAETMGKRTS
ncbi:MAG: polyprenyl synthetase family protein [Opitutaceae bacterium]|nr:polyprenyl synthetase family protein [Opitutaceae bacterium]MBP8962975.1 polyprenyl synthetase family protein [Opitutaceae bacterium]